MRKLSDTEQIELLKIIKEIVVIVNGYERRCAFETDSLAKILDIKSVINKNKTLLNKAIKY